MFAEIKIAVKCNAKITYTVWLFNAMIKDGCREEMSKCPGLSGCSYNDEICFVGIDPKFTVCHPAWDITEAVTKLFKGKINVCCR